jgi:flavin-dependent dehydrogenase
VTIELDKLYLDWMAAEAAEQATMVLLGARDDDCVDLSGERPVRVERRRQTQVGDDEVVVGGQPSGRLAGRAGDELVDGADALRVRTRGNVRSKSTCASAMP